MKIKHTSLSLAAAAIALVACASASSLNMLTHSTVAGRFSALRVSGSLGVELRQVPDSAGMVVVEASERAMPHVKISNTDGTLHVNYTPDEPSRHYGREVKRVVVYCGEGGVGQLTLGGSGAISASGLRTRGDLTAVLSGSGAMSLRDVSCANFTATLSGSGALSLDGVKARNVSTSLIGSGALSADVDATAFNCTVSGSGAASVRGKADKVSLALRGSGVLDASRLGCSQLSVSAAGSGILKYNTSVTPKIVSGRASAPGIITK